MAGFSEVDLNGVFTAVNDSFCEIVGRTREELLRLNLLDFTHPDDRPRNKIVFQRAVAEGTPYAHEKRYVRPHGSAVRAAARRVGNDCVSTFQTRWSTNT